jgi:inorganic pyrophosphatase/exopolyphosphatase
MLSAIIADSLLFKSPTCTDEDVKAAKELAAIAGVDADSYGLDMLKAGADLSAKTIPQLLSLDAKEFTMGSHKVEIAQVNTVDTNDVLSRKAEVEAELAKVVSEKGLDLFVFVVTDILTNDSVVVCFRTSCTSSGESVQCHIVRQHSNTERRCIPQKTNCSAVNRSLKRLRKGNEKHPNHEIRVFSYAVLDTAFRNFRKIDS